jgi:TPR repeat protein
MRQLRNPLRTPLLLLALTCGSVGGAEAAPGNERKALRKACDAGEAEACLNLAHALAEGDRGPANPKQALGLYEDTLCKALGTAPEPAPTRAARAAGCHFAGLAHAGGEFVPVDGPRASALYARACEADHLDACGSLARTLREGRGVPADLPRARAVHGSACDRGRGESCAEAGRMSEAGEGGPVDLAEARRRQLQGCDAGLAPACLVAADMCEAGRGGEVDSARGKALRARACTLGGERFCPDEPGAEPDDSPEREPERVPPATSR